jgi:hypothetical protein
MLTPSPIWSVTLLDDLAQMNADPELNPSFRRQASIRLVVLR